MVIVRISVPQIALLTVPASAKGQDEEQPLLPVQPGSNPDPAGQDRIDRTAEAESSGSELDRTQDEEQLITQLQAYFQESIRCAGVLTTSCLAPFLEIKVQTLYICPLLLAIFIQNLLV